MCFKSNQTVLKFLFALLFFSVFIESAKAESLVEALRKIYPMYEHKSDEAVVEAYRKKFYPDKTLAELEKAFETRGQPRIIEGHGVTVIFPHHYSEEQIELAIKSEVLPHLNKNKSTWYISSWPESVRYIVPSETASGTNYRALGELSNAVDDLKRQMLIDRLLNY
jgi:hypothetical protein